MSTSTRNLPNRLGKHTNVFLASAELAAIVSKLGKIPTVAGYFDAMGIVNKGGAAIYKYLNFNEIEEYVDNAKNATVRVDCGDYQAFDVLGIACVRRGLDRLRFHRPCDGSFSSGRQTHRGRCVCCQRSAYGFAPTSATYVMLGAALLDSRSRQVIAMVNAQAFQWLPFVALDAGPSLKPAAEGDARVYQGAD